MNNNLDVVKNLSVDLLNLLKVEAQVAVSESDDSIKINIETNNSGGLIGYHGEGLISLQLVLNILASKATGDWQRVVVNVGDYRQKREEYLKNLALSAAERARLTKQPSVLTGLSSFERRIIHTVLSAEKDLSSESEGEGQDRRLVVRLRA